MPSASTEIKLIIDSFEVSSAEPVVVVLNRPAPPAVDSSGFDRGASIIGGERDMALIVQQGSSGGVCSCKAIEDIFVIGANGGSAFVILQYDGPDGSINLDTVNGLGGLNLTADGAIGFEIVALSDIDSELSITVVDKSGTEFTAGIVIPATEGPEPVSSLLLFSDFPRVVNFGEIVAIEFFMEAFNGANLDLFSLNTFGPL